MILKRCSAFPAFFSCPSSVSSGRALRGTNAQSDTLNLFVGIGAEITQMSHSFPPFSFFISLLLGIVSLVESSRIPPRCKPGTNKSQLGFSRGKKQKTRASSNYHHNILKERVSGSRVLVPSVGKKKQGEDQACVNVTRSEADRHHS